MAETSDPDALALVELFERFGPLYRRRVGEGLPHGVSPARLRLMALLAEHGPLSMAEASRALGATAQNLTGLVDSLESEGLIRRQADPDDRRKTRIALADTTLDLVRSGREAHRQRVGEVFTALSVEDRASLRRIIATLIEALSQPNSPADP